MAKQDAIQDRNLFPAMIAHSGTAGTADTIRVLASAAGALKVDIVTGDEIIIKVGTINTLGTVGLLQSGTITELEGGTVQTNIETGTVDLLKGGTITKLEGGTVETNEIEPVGFNGGTVSVGTAAVEMTFTGVTQAMAIQADHDNTNTIYLGASNVTLTGANAVKRLEAGEDVSMDLNDATAPIYAVGGTTGQKVYKFALT